MTATNVVVSKYFHGKLGSPDRERSVKQLIERVARTIYTWGLKSGYFASQEDIGNIGGLENLKEWLTKRSMAFTEKAAE